MAHPWESHEILTFPRTEYASATGKTPLSAQDLHLERATVRDSMSAAGRARPTPRGNAWGCPLKWRRGN